jgi:GR25 family glycosyltransferase involved in LPS biosynthesis
MKTYIINLPHRKDRLEKVLSFNLPSPEVVEAVYYSQLSDTQKEFWNDKIITEENFIDSDGAMGCFASHYTIWNYISKREDEYALVVEDDVNFKSNIDSILKELPEDFDILFLGGTYEGGYFKFGVYKPEFHKKNAFTTEAYIVSKKGAFKLLDLVDNKKSSSCNVDWYLHNLGKKNLINYYGTYPLMCYQTHRDSDIK